MNDRQMLNEEGIDYIEIDVELDRINQTDIMAAQSRIDGLDPDQVRIYAECMKNGDVFPEIVVQANKQGRYQVLSGNHRVRAAQNIGRTHLPALLVAPTDAQRDMIVAGANNRHGKPITMDDRKLQACRKVEVYGWTYGDAAKAFGLTEAIVKNAIAARKARARWDEVMPEGPLKKRVPSDNRLMYIGRLHSDDAFLACAEIIEKLTSDDLADLCAEANRKRKESDAVAVFTAAAQDITAREHAAAKKGKASPSLTSQITKYERSLRRITPEQIRSQPKDEMRSSLLALDRIILYLDGLRVDAA